MNAILLYSDNLHTLISACRMAIFWVVGERINLRL